MTNYRTLAALGAAAAILTGTASAAIIDVSTTADTVAVGETFEVRLAFTAETTDEFLTGADFEFVFDDALFSFVGVDFVDDTTGVNQLALDGDPDAFGPGIFDVADDILPGEITVSALSDNSLAFLAANQADDFSIVTLTFQADMVGTGDLGLGVLQDFLAETLGGDFVDVSILNDAVTVTVGEVPLPGAAVFLATGIAGLFARRRLAA